MKTGGHTFIPLSTLNRMHLTPLLDLWAVVKSIRPTDVEAITINWYSLQRPNIMQFVRENHAKQLTREYDLSIVYSFRGLAD